MDTLIRKATEQDLPAILDIYNDAILHTTAVYNYEPHTLDMRKEWWRQKQLGNFPVWVAERSGAVAGFSTYGPFRMWAAYKYTAEVSVYIAPGYRRLGIAKLLYASLLQSAKEQQLHTLVAGIDAANDSSIRLHEHFGFVPVAHFREVGFKFGRWLDLVFMQLILPTPDHPAEG